MGSLTEITGTYLRERYRWDDTAIVAVWVNGETSDEIAVKVTCDDGELREEQEYRWLGRWIEHAKYGRQFHAQSFVLKLPHGRQGVISYLVDAGEGLGFGRKRAAALWEHWGSEAVEQIRKSPEQAVEILSKAKLKLPLEKIKTIAAKLEEDAGLESCTLDLLDVLTGRGFPRATVRECVRAWGNRAAQIIRRDPYRLMRFRGCGFKRCDALYLELGLPPARLKRQALAAWYAIARDTEGHTWFPSRIAEMGVLGSVGGVDVNVGRALRLAVRGKALAAVTTDGAKGPIVGDELAGGSAGPSWSWVAEERKAQNELDIAEAVADAMREGGKWPIN